MDEKPGGLTLRSVLLGIVVAILANVGPIYSGYIVGSSWSDFGHLPLVTLLLFTLIAGPLNGLVGKIAPRSMLTHTELLVVLMMGWVAATMQGEWLTGYFLGIITSPHYFASPENRWGEYLIPHLPRWLVVGGSAAQWFYEGLPKGMAFPWREWAIPLFWWFTFFGALILVFFSIAIVLRKQWAEYERLPFPLAEVPLILIKRTGKSVIPDILKTRLFCAGFLISFVIICWNMINWFTPVVPKIPLISGFLQYPQIALGRDFPPFHAKIDVFVIGFAFLTRADVLLSIWLFHVLSILQSGVFARIGYSIGPSDGWGSFDAATGYQSFGGFVFFTLWGLYMARSHLRSVWRLAFGRSSDNADTDEILLYRRALLGMLLGLIYAVAWLLRSGMTTAETFAFLGATLLLYIGLAKIIAECGLVYLRGPVTAQDFTYHALGVPALTSQGTASLGLSFSFFCDGKAFVMPAAAHIARLTGLFPGRKSPVVLAVLSAAFIGAATSITYVLYEGYSHGAYNFLASTYRDTNVSIWNEVVTRLRNPFGPDWKRLSFAGMGAALTASMTYLRYRLPWWPVHPVGFTVASVFPIRDSAFGIFVIWLTKVLMAKVGGKELYQKGISLFLGLLIGYVIGVGTGFVVDTIWFNGAGHRIHGY